MFSRSENIQKDNCRAALTNLVDAIQNANVQYDEIISALDKRAKFLLSNLDSMDSDLHFIKGLSDTIQKQDFVSLCEYILHITNDKIEEQYLYKRREYCKSYDTNFDTFVSLTFIAMGALFVLRFLGYLAFAIAAAASGHTATLAFASGLFYSITGYGLLGAFGLMVLAVPVKLIANKACSSYYDSKISKVNEVFETIEICSFDSSFSERENVQKVSRIYNSSFSQLNIN